jgi:hypothetical protein
MKTVFVFPPVRKHQAGNHDQSSHGNWSKGLLAGHDFTDSDGATVNVSFGNLKNKLTEKQKKEFRTIIYDLKTKTDLTGLSKIDVYITDYEPYFNNNKGERGNTKAFQDDYTRNFEASINIRAEDLLRTEFQPHEKNVWMKRSTEGKVTSVAEYLMAHEWGHVVDYHRRFVKESDSRGDGSDGAFVIKTLSDNRDGLSYYGRSERREGYAEVYADWFMNDGKGNPSWMDEMAKEQEWQK